MRAPRVNWAHDNEIYEQATIAAGSASVFPISLPAIRTAPTDVMLSTTSLKAYQRMIGPAARKSLSEAGKRVAFTLETPGDTVHHIYTTSVFGSYKYNFILTIISFIVSLDYSAHHHHHHRCSPQCH